MLQLIYCITVAGQKLKYRSDKSNSVKSTWWMQTTCTHKQNRARILRMSSIFQSLKCCRVTQNFYHRCTLEVDIARACRWNDTITAQIQRICRKDRMGPDWCFFIQLSHVSYKSCAITRL